jgi:hypothetical protein
VLAHRASALRMPRERTRRQGRTFISPEIMISQRPAEAADRAVPGHWEGDLILGLGSSAIGTLVERTTRFTLLLHLPRMTGHGQETRVKNGPALAGHGAEAVRDAITRAIFTLPEQLRRWLTWDQGAELAQHARLKIDAGVQVYFCDPHSPWQRGTNENTNGLLRQHFPKGTDLSAHNAGDLEAVAFALNTRPRKTLGWKTPAETLDEFLRVSPSTPTKARSSPVRPLPAYSPATTSPSAWTAKGLGGTTSGAASNTRRSICEPTKPSARREARLVDISTFTTGDDRIRALTTGPRIKPTSIFLRSARRPNPGRRSTYRRGIVVQTTGTGSLSLSNHLLGRYNTAS